MRHATLMGCAAAAALAIGSAHATLLIGSNDIGSGEVSSTTLNLSLNSVLTNSFSYLGTSWTGAFRGSHSAFDFLTAESAVYLNGSSPYSWSSNVGNFSGVVVPAYDVLTINSPFSSTLSLYVLGTFTPLGTLSQFSPSPMSETISYTETMDPGGLDAAYSFSATIASPPTRSDSVPEPGSLAVMGTGLAGLAVARQRRRRDRRSGR